MFLLGYGIYIMYYRHDFVLLLIFFEKISIKSIVLIEKTFIFVGEYMIVFDALCVLHIFERVISGKIRELDGRELKI